MSEPKSNNLTDNRAPPPCADFILHGGRTGPGGPKILATLDSILKVLGGGVGIVAAMGLPAVYLHLNSFGLPPTLIFGSEIAKAGILPALAFVLASAYVVSATRTLKTGGWRALALRHGVLLIPLVALTLTIMLIGVACLLILYLYAVLWAIVWFLNLFVTLQISNRSIIIVSAVLVALAALVLGTLRFTYPRWENRPGKIWEFFRLLFKKRSRKSADDNAPTTADVSEKSHIASKPATQMESDESWGKLLLQISLMMPFMYAVLVYSIKGVVYIWNSEAAAWLSHSRLLLVAVVSSALYIAFMATTVLMDHTGRPQKPARPTLFVCVVSLLFLIAVGVYSKSLYPHIPLGLGGGKPAPIELWFAANQPYCDLESTLKRATFTKVGELIKTNCIFLLYSDANRLLLLDSSIPPASAILVKRERFISMSW